jgi:hypothetical protein
LTATLVAILLLYGASGVFAQADASTSREAKLAEEFSDPLTTLPQLFLQSAYTPTSYGTEAQANRVIAHLIVPRVPRFSLLPFVQLIRPSLSLVTVPRGRGKGTVTARMPPSPRRRRCDSA